MSGNNYANWPLDEHNPPPRELMYTRPDAYDTANVYYLNAWLERAEMQWLWPWLIDLRTAYYRAWAGPGQCGDYANKYQWRGHGGFGKRAG